MMKRITALALLLLLSYSCKKEVVNLTKISAKNNLIDSSTPQDSTIINLFLPYKDKMIKEINTVISYTPKNLVRTDGELQSTLGNFLADVCFEKGNEIFSKKNNKQADFALFNYGGIRAGITAGNITFENAFKLMPFENTLVVVELSYDKVQELATYFLIAKRAHPLSKQIQITIKNNKTSVLINGKPLDKNRSYFVITSNYLQNGGDHMNFFKDPISLLETDYLMRQAIVDGFKKQDTVKVTLDNRVIIK